MLTCLAVTGLSGAVYLLVGQTHAYLTGVIRRNPGIQELEKKEKKPVRKGQRLPICLPLLPNEYNLLMVTYKTAYCK